MFSSVYNCFLAKITDDMYLELTPEDTVRDLQSLLVNAIPGFEFPRKSLVYYLGEPDGLNDSSYFLEELSSEEINILAILMLENWLQRQIASIENIRMKYSGTDFKMTSQANHIGKLLNLQTEIRRQSLHMQRLYKRRKIDSNGKVSSNWSVFRSRGTIFNSQEEKMNDSGIIDLSVVYDGGNAEKDNPQIIYDGGRI